MTKLNEGTECGIDFSTMSPTEIIDYTTRRLDEAQEIAESIKDDINDIQKYFNENPEQEKPNAKD